MDNNYIIICIIKKSITQYLITDILVETMQYKVKIYIMPDKSNTWFNSSVSESWLSCEKTAVLQGGFVLANQICQPEPLLSLKKEDWDRIGCPIVNAIKEICEHSLKDTKDRVHWRKRILCIVWSKILEVRNKEDIDIRWKEDPLFAVQNSLPDINHTVLFELVKSMSFLLSMWSCCCAFNQLNGVKSSSCWLIMWRAAAQKQIWSCCWRCGGNYWRAREDVLMP